MKKLRKNIWKKREENHLKKNYGKIQTREIQKKYLPNRSISSIHERARKLGLKSTLFSSDKQKKDQSKRKKEWWNNPKNKIKQKKCINLLKFYSRNDNPMKNPLISKKVGDKLRNIPKSKEHRKKLSIAKLKLGSWGKHTEKSKRKIGLKHKNKNVSEETRKKLSDTRIKLELAKGKNNPNYKDGKSKEPYPMNWNDRLKESIRNRDKKCKICGMSRNIHKKYYKRDLLVHHIDRNKNNLNLNNLICLCSFHHLKIQKIEENLKDYFYAKNLSLI